MFTTDYTPPCYFVKSNMTQYQYECIQEKWYIYNYIESSKKENMSCFRDLGNELGKSTSTIRDIYYNIKTNDNESTPETS